jgi:hypothetical protein
MVLEDWKKLVLAPVLPLLKARGYRKFGHNFSAVRTSATLWVNLQSSTSSTKAHLKITCNLGIVLHPLTDESRRSVYDAHWRERIGFFLPDPHDRWWICGSDSEAITAGQEIALLLENRALPEMDHLASPEAMAALWSSGRSPGLTDRLRRDYLAQLTVAG